MSRRNLPTESERASLQRRDLRPHDLSASDTALDSAADSANPHSSGAGTSLRAMPPLAIRLGLSFLIIGHLWGVIGRPLEFATQGPFGPSPSMTLLRRPLRGYGEFMYLDHGYAFFAPEPGPSHLIRATIARPGGDGSQDVAKQVVAQQVVAQQVVEKQEAAEPQAATQQAAKPAEGDASVVRFFPDRVDQWPRLLYHRHFMLAEFLNTVYHPPGEPPLEIRNDVVASRDWRMSRARYEAVRDSIVRCLNKKYPGMGVTIDRIEHRQPGLPEFVRDGVKLDAPQLYLVLEDVLPQPSVPQPNTPETLPRGAAAVGGAAQESGAVPGQSPGTPPGQSPGTPPGQREVETEPKGVVNPSDAPSEPMLNSPLNLPRVPVSPDARSSRRKESTLSIARSRLGMAALEVKP